MLWLKLIFSALKLADKFLSLQLKINLGKNNTFHYQLQTHTELLLTVGIFLDTTPQDYIKEKIYNSL